MPKSCLGLQCRNGDLNVNFFHICLSGINVYHVLSMSNNQNISLDGGSSYNQHICPTCVLTVSLALTMVAEGGFQHNVGKSQSSPLFC